MISADWYRKNFTQEEIEEIKAYDKEKQERLKSNSYNKDFKTRWVGTACEMAFDEYLEESGIDRLWHLNKGVDYFDFTIETLNIDVKAVSTNYEPQLDYGADVVEKQVEKMKKYKNINVLVFCRFNLKTNQAIVLGWITFKSFVEKAKYQEAGTKLGEIIISTPQYEVKIAELRRLSKLKVLANELSSAVDPNP